MTIRPTFHELFLLQAKLAASRSTCNSRPQGAVLVKNNRVIATGYNGALPGQEHCSDQEHIIIKCPKCGDMVQWDTEGVIQPLPSSCPICHGRKKVKIPYCRRRASGAQDFLKDRACASAHAEANAVAQAARMGVAVDGSVLYCTTRPCAVCTKILVMAGVVWVYFELDYDDPDGDWLRELLPMERLEVRPKTLALAMEMLQPGTSRRRLGRTE
jgi:dCMP deaminase